MKAKLYQYFRGVIPDAVQRETVHRRAGIVTNAGAP